MSTTTGRDQYLWCGYTKKPVAVCAVRWTGDNLPTIRTLAGSKFDVVDPEDRGDDPEISAQVFDELHSTWVGVKTGQWIICGVRGEFYPCDDAVFAETYERTVPAASVSSGPAVTNPPQEAS